VGLRLEGFWCFVVSGCFVVLQVFGVLWVSLFLVLVRCFPLYTVGVPRGTLRFL
jgi:hypothetical protein